MKKKLVINCTSLCILLFVCGCFAEQDEKFESFTKCQQQYSSISSDKAKERSLFMNCSSLQMHNVLGSWPEGNYTQLIANFAYNDIKRLGSIAPSGALDMKIIYSHCNIEELESGIITDAVNVSYLDLSYNKITSDQLHSDIFKGPVNNQSYEPIYALRHLNLAYNQIHTLRKNMFEHIPNLQELILEGNDLRMIDVSTALTFSDIPKLKYLNLANNGLMEISQGILKNFKNLKKLDISRNELEFVPKELGLIGDSLQVIILDYNPILEMNGETFIGVRNLTQIYASHLDRLEVVETNTFAHLENLRVLYLTHNPKLNVIKDEAFGKIQNLRNLQINDNNLSSLHPHMVNWTELRVLNMANNPFICTCNLYNITLNIPSRLRNSSEEKPLCYDSPIYTLKPMYSLKKDVCETERSMYKSLLGYADGSFRILRMSVLIATITLVVVLTAAAILMYAKWKAYLRSQSYPFASQVVYNPISTDIKI